jgi:lipoyl(octanoyl) transferase
MDHPPADLPVLEVFRAHTLGYAEGVALQEAWVRRRRAGEIPDRLVLLEHPHVVTMGRGTDPSNLLLSGEALEAAGYELHEVGRGGDVTYHGPGQLVGYPVLDLKPGPGRPDRRDLHRYLRTLEQVLIHTLAELGVAAERSEGLTGVWTPSGKVAAIGVRVSSGWITSHGFALNLSPELARFGAIVPCGIRDRAVTSLEALLGAPPSRAEVESRLVAAMGRELGARVVVRPEMPGPGV